MIRKTFVFSWRKNVVISTPFTLFYAPYKEINFNHASLCILVLILLLSYDKRYETVNHTITLRIEQISRNDSLIEIL